MISARQRRLDAQRAALGSAGSARSRQSAGSWAPSAASSADRSIRLAASAGGHCRASASGGSPRGSERSAPSRAGSCCMSDAASSRRSVASRASSTGRSVIGDLPRSARPPEPWQPANYQAPTRELLGDNASCRSSSYGSSVRTPTTVREFFEEEDRWAASSNAGSMRPSAKHSLPGRPPRPSVGKTVTPAQAASVLPGVPPGKIPGVPPRSKDLLFAPSPTSQMVFG